MAEDSVPIDMSTIQELVKTVKLLQSDMAELKSGGNGVNKLLTQTEPSGSATLPQTGTRVCGKSPPRKGARDKDYADLNDKFKLSDEDGHMFSLSEVGSTYMEAAFKNKMNASARMKKMAKLRLPDCK